MSLFDPEHPQHLAHLARAKAASRRTTEMLDAGELGGIAREQHSELPRALSREVPAGRPGGGSLPTNSCAGIAEAKAAAAIHWKNKRRAA